jgi:uncharacterized protein
MVQTPRLYRAYSDFLLERYGEKVYKIPINLPVGCPNRDGTCGRGGCIYCGDDGAGFEDLPSSLSVQEQIAINQPKMRKKFKAKKFIAYFQNFTNTYMPLAELKRCIYEAAEPNIVEIALSTRPDCINDALLVFLQEFSEETGIRISLEVGLQTVNYHTLAWINRGHSLAEFIDSILRIRPFGFDVCVHLILNLPGDALADAVEAAKILTVLEVAQVKLHALYIVKNTPLADLFLAGKLTLTGLDEYIERVIAFLEHLDPDIVVQRLLGRAPEEDTLWANWNTSWWKIKEEIEQQMVMSGRYQGRLCTYRNGPAIRHFYTCREGGK